jgi:hypothetical protein
MAMITQITRLPPPVRRVEHGESVESIARSQLSPISDAMPSHVEIPDHLLLLSRKLARQSHDECAAMAGSVGDGLD